MDSNLTKATRFIKRVQNWHPSKSKLKMPSTDVREGPTRKKWQAVHDGNVEELRGLVEAGADVNAKMEGGAAPLHLAAGIGRVEVVKVLVELGADVNAQVQKQFNGEATPLHWAASEGHTEAVKVLVEAGADVNAHTHYGATPLHSAATPGRVEAMKVLVEAGGDVNARKQDGDTPLRLAANKGHAKAMRVLVPTLRLASRCPLAPWTDSSVGFGVAWTSTSSAAIWLEEVTFVPTWPSVG